MKTILDPSFRYTPSFNTDLKKTFARIRRDCQKAEKSHPAPAEAIVNIASIVRRTAGHH